MAGVLIAILGFIGVVVFAPKGGGGGTGQDIVVAARAIPVRTELTAADLQIAHYTTSTPVAGAYLSTKDVVGQIAAVPFTAGQPILANLVSSSAQTIVGVATSYLPIPKGFVGVTIPSGEQQAVAGYVQPGDYISVIATVTPVGSKYPEARTIFTNLHVIRVGPAVAGSSVTGTQAQGQASGVSSSLTVVVSQCDAEYLTWFLTYTSLRYTLESYQDYQSTPTKNPDATCPAVTAAKGATGSDVAKRWPGLLNNAG